MQAKRVVLVGVLWCMMALLNVPPAHAEEVREKIVYANPVTISVDNADPATARDNALKQGAVEALRMLVASLPGAGAEMASRISKTEAENLFYGVSVEQEQIGDNFYRAIFRYSFRQAALDAYLNSQGIAADIDAPTPAAEVVQGVMVVPIWQQGTEMQLAPHHPWWQAWQQIATNYPNEKISLPAGDMDDLKQLIPTKLLGKQDGPLEYLKQKYHVQRVLVVLGQETITAREAKAISKTAEAPKPVKAQGEKPAEEPLAEDGTVPESVQAQQTAGAYPVNIYAIEIQLSPANRAQEFRFTLPAQMLMARGAQSSAAAAADPTYEELANRYDLFTAVAGTSQEVLTGVIVPISSLEAWRQTRLAIEHTVGVVSVEVKRLTKAEAVLDISMIGSIENLQAALTEQKLQLQQFGSNWMITAE